MISTFMSAEQEALITGVFAFLDTVLSPEQRELVQSAEPAIIRSYQKPWDYPKDSIDIRVHQLVRDSFRLQYVNCPIRDALKPFRLYYAEDMADALTHAYFLHMRGDDPLKALGGDYVLKPYGLPSWMGWEQMGEGDNYEMRVKNEFHRYHEAGDRVIFYRMATDSGYLLVRGDRLVCHLPGTHFLVVGRHLPFEAACQEFERLGGNRGFLAESFIWPPDSWTNPASEEDGSKS